jgi:N-acetylneuraminic acid mutarotase
MSILTPPTPLVEPEGRRGQWSVVHGGKFYLYGGYTAGKEALTFQSMIHLHVFDVTTCEWSVVKTGGNRPRSYSGACSTLIGDKMYMFGGWFMGMRKADIHELNLVNYEWKKLTSDDYMEGSPLLKDKAGMVAYGTEMLCVTGGYGYPCDFHRKQKGASFHLDANSYYEIGWTNELHLFHIKSRK